MWKSCQIFSRNFGPIRKKMAQYQIHQGPHLTMRRGLPTNGLTDYPTIGLTEWGFYQAQGLSD